MCGEISLGDIKLGCIDVNVAPEKNIWSLLVSYPSISSGDHKA
jgi:hypothetical protein